MTSSIAANWERVRQRVAAAARRAGREPSSVRIVAVSKTQPAETLAQALAAGVREVGENYVQEALAKARQLTAPVVWHLIGHLQRNKAARAVELFDVIHTLDSAALAAALARHGAERRKLVRVLIEVNVGGEATKSGVAPAEVAALVRDVARYDALRLEGLMAIPPPVASAEDARPYFRELRAVRDRVCTQAPSQLSLPELSMGMTDDFEVAIEEGATMVRIGRAIFGERR